jgi:hypothetical protein
LKNIWKKEKENWTLKIKDATCGSSQSMMVDGLGSPIFLIALD